MVYGFVQRAGGLIEVHSHLGEGTTFNIFIPIANEENHTEGNENIANTDLVSGSETILVVDDEEALRDIAVACLDELGYATVTASDGKQALKLLKENNNIDLLFSDIIMPGNYDGYHLAADAHNEFPSLRILLASGFTNKREEHINDPNGYISKLASNLLSKPYNQTELACAVRRTLDE